jgi:DNA-binding MarR family transcriptional regulator
LWVINFLATFYRYFCFRQDVTVNAVTLNLIFAMTFKQNFNQQKLIQKANKEKIVADKEWWIPLWIGILSAKHYQIMRSSLWLYLYFLLHANRNSGTLKRKIPTIARDMELNQRTISRWIKILKQNEYIETKPNGHSLEIKITKWKTTKK